MVALCGPSTSQAPATDTIMQLIPPQSLASSNDNSRFQYIHLHLLIFIGLINVCYCDLVRRRELRQKLWLRFNW